MTPQGALERPVACGRCDVSQLLPTRRAIESPPNLVERPSRLLHRLDAEKLIQMTTGVVISSPDAKRRRQQLLLDVVTDGAARDSPEIGQLADAVSGVFRHVG
jgi:hypothetical protein